MKTTDAAALYKTLNHERTADAARCETERTGTGRQSLRTRIAQQPFFRGFSDEHLQLFTESARERDFEPGEAILEEGSEADCFYLILEGKVVLGAELEDRGIVPVQTLEPGDGLGWSWLFAPYRLHLSARALAPTRMIFFYGARLREAAEQDHEFGYQLMKRITEVVTRRLRATQQRLVECTSMRTLFNP
jgi:CRP/FNR family cyclic AMP-dependent transcriptional regulator